MPPFPNDAGRCAYRRNCVRPPAPPALESISADPSRRDVLHPGDAPETRGPDPFTPADADRLYHVSKWGMGYFGITESGHVEVKPLGKDGPALDVYEVVEDLRAQGVQTPFLVRFQDLLHTRVARLNEAFARAIRETGYRNVYQGVFPIKVNQLREVVEEVLEAGQPFRYGLECGSKAELVATLPYLESEEMLLVCNGYKDAEMMRLLRAGQLLGKNVIPILERPEEIEMLREVARGEIAGDEPDGPRPAAFGVRVRLATQGAGLWSESGGEGSKFGLSFADLVALVKNLRASKEPLDFRLLHYHLGSQLSSADNVRMAALEAGRVYAWLRKQGLDIRYVDIGGGLGVTYDAGNADVRGGIDYTLGEFTKAVVGAIREACDAEGVPHPVIVSESGRAVAAYHSMLVVEVVSRRAKGEAEDVGLIAGHAFLDRLEAADEALTAALAARSHAEQAVAAAAHLAADAGGDGSSGDGPSSNGPSSNGSSIPASPSPIDLDAVAATLDVLREEAATLFREGRMPLEAKAHAETRLWAIQRRLRDAALASHDARLSPPLAALDRALADHYLCDFSVFRSMVDHWAIGQRFPIVPLHRLDEAPPHRGTLVDLTCDSDGKVSSYISPSGDKYALELHDVHPGQPYLLGVFLMGAYQDIMGDMHNLFGRVTEAHVYADDDEPEGYYVEQILPGQTVEDILASVQYFPNDLVRRMDKLVRREVKRGRIRPKEGVKLLGLYRAAFRSYTYVDVDAP